MDVVYINRPGERNDELRYSLRSLANLPHDRVWIVGHTPRWTRNVESLEVEQRAGKQANAFANLKAACETPAISRRFYLMNDDFFLMRPMRRLPVLHRGRVVDVIAQHRLGGTYARAMIATYKLMVAIGIHDPLSYEMHAPMAIDRGIMLRALAAGADIRGLHNRTLYGNLARVGGSFMPDCKVYNLRDTGWKAWPFLSTNDGVFYRHPVGLHIRQRFRKPSPYEKP